MSITSKQGEVSTVVVLSVLAVIGAATFLNTTLNKQRVTTSTNAQTPTSCPFDSGQGVQLGETESNDNNNEPRWPISQHKKEYDFFSYFVPASLDEARSSNHPVISQEKYLTFADEPGGNVDSKMNGFMGKMFGFKPTRLSDAYFMKYRSSSDQGADTLVKGSAPALKVPVEAGDSIMMPDTGYSIGGGMEAMVVFADSDKITLHIGRHEYFVGSGQNNCNGGTCSGGYWIYLKGLCVDQQIVNKYNEVKGAQESAGANEDPIMLPMIEANRVIGKASGSTIDVLVRDNGPLISIHRPVYWQGVSEKNPGGNVDPTESASQPTATPSGGLNPTATPSATIKPTATPTPPAGSVCGYGGQRCCNPSDSGANVSCRDGSNCVSGQCTFPTAAPTQGTRNPTANPTDKPYKVDFRIEKGTNDYLVCGTIQNASRPYSFVVGVDIKNANTSTEVRKSVTFSFKDQNQVECLTIPHNICTDVGACNTRNTYEITYIVDGINSFTNELSETNNTLRTAQLGVGGVSVTPTPTPNQSNNGQPFMLQSETIMEVCNAEFTNAPCLRL